MEINRLTLVLMALGCQWVTSEARGDKIPLGVEGHGSHVKPFFEKYCITCHGPEKSKGDITLHTLDGAFELEQDLAHWEDVLEVLDFEEMPPEDEPQPSKEEREAIKEWIDGGLREYVNKASEVASVPTTRRLTNFEYQNTMRDLLGFELKFSQNLPEDPKKPYHFNNSAEFMLLGPEQVDRYLENARKAMASAIVDPVEPEVFRKKQSWNMAQAEIPVYKGPGVGNLTVGLNAWPKTGEYRIRIKAAGNFPEGFEEVPLRLVMGTSLRSDSGTGEYEPVGIVHLRNGLDDIQEFEFRGRIENHPIQIGQVTAKGQAPPSMTITAQNLFDNGELNDHRRSAFDASWSNAVPRVVLTSLEFEAPVTDVWPPAHHTRILFDSPLRESDPEAYLREVLRRFVSRAFRRPATDQEIERFIKVYRLVEDEFDTFEGAIRETLAVVLISPQFLYHTVKENPKDNPQYALASKLSYFLWSSMPDEELMRLAEARQLDDPAVIEKQVRRMLVDARSKQFAENFTTQWLSLEKMKSVNINQNLFPRFLYYVHVGERRGQEILFRPTIRDYMHEETVGFIVEMIRRNSSVRSIIDSDFAWLNEPLAYHYGVEGVSGLKMRAVTIKPEHRIGGLPTQGSILIGNGTGSAPHPIYRAVWLREAILGDEVKPPPAEVPALADSAGDSADQALSIKDLLKKHREVESCNDCHVRLDPWGIPFERYNAIGKYQPRVPNEGTQIRGFSITEDKDQKGYQEYLDKIFTNDVDATARVPHGPEVDGMRDLKDYLLKDRVDDIAENVVRRLLTYGLGRSLTYRDRYAVEELVKNAKGKDYAIADMIVSVCLSDTFRETTSNTKKK